MEKITNNFWWKILSLGLAFLLWLIVVNYEDPYTTVTISDITVNKINESAITSQKKAIDYKEGETVTLRLRGKRSVVDRLTASDIYAYADLEKKSITGAVDIQVEVGDGITILDKDPSVMLVELENIVTVQKEVQYYMEGEPADGYTYLEPEITPNNIEVEGPESKISQIKSVLVPVNIDGATKDVTLYGTPQVVDDDNEEISGVTISVSQVEIQVPIERVKTIDLKESLPDTLVADGYELVDSSLSQDTLTVRGTESELSDLSQLTISDLGVSGLTEDTTASVSVEDLLPSGVEVYNDASSIDVYLEVEPIVEKTIEISQSDITVHGLPENMQFSYQDEESYMLTFTGIQSKLDDLTLSELSPSIDLDGLEEGEHEVELDFYQPYGVELTSEEPTVNVALVEETSSDEESTDTDTDDDSDSDTESDTSSDSSTSEDSSTE